MLTKDDLGEHFQPAVHVVDMHVTNGWLYLGFEQGCQVGRRGARGTAHQSIPCGAALIGFGFQPLKNRKGVSPFVTPLISSNLKARLFTS